MRAKRFPYSKTTVLGYDAFGTAQCEVSYRRWHPGYWWFRLKLWISPPDYIMAPLAEDGTWSDPVELRA